MTVPYKAKRDSENPTIRVETQLHDMPVEDHDEEEVAEEFPLIDVARCEALAKFMSEGHFAEGLKALADVIEASSEIPTVIELGFNLTVPSVRRLLETMSDDEALSTIVRIADVLILHDVALLDVFELVPSMHMKLLADGTFGDRESTLLFFSNLAQVLGLGGFSAIVSDDMVVAITEAFVEADALQDPRLINLAAMIVAIGLDRGMTEWNSLMVYMEECIMRADDDSPMSRVLELIMDTISNEQLMNGPD